MKRRNWTREETIVAFNVYCKIPFKDSSSNHPLIIEYAKLIGRSAASLNMKVGNFGRLDPELKRKGIVGLRNGSHLEEIVWHDFHGNWEKLAYESEYLIEKFRSLNYKEPSNIKDFPIGKDKESKIKTRVNQSFFRAAILCS